MRVLERSPRTAQVGIAVTGFRQIKQVVRKLTTANVRVPGC